MKLWITLGSINMAFAIALGAFGAHGLKGKISEKMMENWGTATQYHLIHAVALLLIGLLIANFHSQASTLTISGWLILAGIILFSGSLYIMALTNFRTLGAITPIGGISFIIAWLLIAFSAWKYIPS